MLFDTHTHLNDEKLDYKNIIDSFKNDNILGCIICGYDLESSKKAIKIAERYNNIFVGIGMHPHDSKNFDNEMLEFLKSNYKNKKVVAIGEIGLDYYYNFSSKEDQKKAFIDQIKLAHQFNLPVIFHVRDAYEDFFEIIENNLQYLKNGAVVHSYGGDINLAKKLVRLGFYISVNGILTFKNSQNLQNIIKEIPLENILIETDCPYLTPMPYRGMINEPKYINLVAKKLAQIKEITTEKVEEITLYNAKALFKKMEI